MSLPQHFSTQMTNTLYNHLSDSELRHATVARGMGLSENFHLLK